MRKLFWTGAISVGLVAVGSHMLLAGRGCCSGENSSGKEQTGTGKEKPAEKDEATLIKEQLPIYPLTTCVVSDEEFGGEMGEPVNFVYEGRLVRFCCKKCKKDFLKDPSKYLAKIDKAFEEKKKKEEPKKDAPKEGHGH